MIVAASETERSRPRLAYLDGLRALAALYVVGFHALGFAGERLSGSWRVVRRLFAFGHEAVAIFIVLSGYCLMLPVASSGQPRLTTSLRTFITRRALRILPAYYVALAASLLLLVCVPRLRVGGQGTIWDNSLPGLELGPIASHVLLVHNWFPAWAFQINGPHWSVATEWQIYFFFPLLLLPAWRRFGPALTTCLSLALGYAPLLFAREAAFAAIPWYIALFTLGMGAAWRSFSPSAEPARARSSFAAFSLAAWAACALGGLVFADWWFRFKPATDLLVGAATACSLVELTRRVRQLPGKRDAVLAVLESRALVSVGHFSYSLYLTHLPVLALCSFGLDGFADRPGPFTLLLLALGSLASLLVALLFYAAVERPFMRVKARRALSHEQ
jgi:peptidoglycan/LPS O-acetylase OafA/YrhL